MNLLLLPLHLSEYLIDGLQVSGHLIHLDQLLEVLCVFGLINSNSGDCYFL